MTGALIALAILAMWGIRDAWYTHDRVWSTVSVVAVFGSLGLIVWALGAANGW
jgi:hypothetical protein